MGGRNARVSTAQTAASTRTASEMQRGLGRTAKLAWGEANFEKLGDGLEGMSTDSS